MMSSNEVRKGVTQAQFNEQSGFILGADAMVLCGAAWYFSGNWVYAVVTFAAIGILIQIKAIAQAFAWVMSAGWAFAAYKASLYFDAGTAGAVVVAAIAGLFALGLHLAAIQAAHDIGDQPAAQK
jgi:hypothetical protein